jgi:integration host factor subunit beta
MTKKEIVKQISDDLDLTQLKVKDIVQKTFDAIVETLLEEGRIELRNFGVFEVKRRKARKARNPRTGEKVNVEPKNVVTFKPGKDMEDKVRKMTFIPTAVSRPDEDDDDDLSSSNGAEKAGGATVATKPARTRKMS